MTHTFTRALFTSVSRAQLWEKMKEEEYCLEAMGVFTDAVVSAGNLEVLKWARANKIPYCTWTLAIVAARVGHLYVLKWASQTGDRLSRTSHACAAAKRVASEATTGSRFWSVREW